MSIHFLYLVYFDFTISKAWIILICFCTSRRNISLTQFQCSQGDQIRNFWYSFQSLCRDRYERIPKLFRSLVLCLAHLQKRSSLSLRVLHWIPSCSVIKYVFSNFLFEKQFKKLSKDIIFYLILQLQWRNESVDCYFLDCNIEDMTDNKIVRQYVDDDPLFFRRRVPICS